MFKDFIFIEEKCYRCFQLPNGKLIDVYSCRYDAKVDLLNEKYIPYSDAKEYEMSNLPTFNDLIEQEIVKEVSCIENTYEIEFEKSNRRRFTLSVDDIKKIRKEFKENGFKVSKKAILHNYFAWKGDLKSGFRDSRNKYHLFSPCGCNLLSFRATTLHPKCADWQTTYEY